MIGLFVILGIMTYPVLGEEVNCTSLEGLCLPGGSCPGYGVPGICPADNDVCCPQPQRISALENQRISALENQRTVFCPFEAQTVRVGACVWNERAVWSFFVLRVCCGCPTESPCSSVGGTCIKFGYQSCSGILNPFRCRGLRCLCCIPVATTTTTTVATTTTTTTVASTTASTTETTASTTGTTASTTGTTASTTGTTATSIPTTTV